VGDTEECKVARFNNSRDEKKAKLSDSFNSGYGVKMLTFCPSGDI
jgi:hypothetical protein